jgi:hypothetical protein
MLGKGSEFIDINSFNYILDFNSTKLFMGSHKKKLNPELDWIGYNK